MRYRDDKPFGALRFACFDAVTAAFISNEDAIAHASERNVREAVRNAVASADFNELATGTAAQKFFRRIDLVGDRVRKALQ